jgi:NAD+ diphosphatase
VTGSIVEAIDSSLYAVASKEAPVPGARRINIRRLFEIAGPEDFHLAGCARQILHWRRTHRYCGICGAPLQRDATERAMFCTPCALYFYPRINPVVITLIHKKSSILLARRSDPGFNYFWSAVAGFVEAGESLEEAVQREIREEVGLKVKNIRYISSQQWPFPNNLMIGFYAEYESGEVKPDGEEIAEAEWFTKETLPRIPSKVSIARHLIDSFFAE